MGSEADTDDNAKLTQNIPSIVDSITQSDLDNFQPYYKRYYEPKYCVSFSKDGRNLDSCILVHTNRVCVVYLSCKHSIFERKQRIKRLNFQVTNQTNRLENAMSGKAKKGAQLLNDDSILCFIETEDNTLYPVYAGVAGKLLEINSEVVKNPNLLIDDLDEGFLAIILPNLKKFEDTMKQLKDKDTYFS